MSAEPFDLDAFMAEVKLAEQGASQEELDKMIPRIRKLLNLAENAGTQQEADAFNAKANRLISKYGISSLLLMESTPEAPRTIADRWFRVGAPYAPDRGMLLSALGSVLGARAVFFPDGPGRRYHLFGAESDLLRIEVLFASLLRQMHRELDRALETYPAGGAQRKVFTRDFMAGYRWTVQDRLAATENAARADAETDRGETPGSPSTSVALAIVDRTALVEQALDRVYPKLGKAKPRKARQGAGVWAGVEAGKRANLGGTDLTAAPAREALGR